MKDLKEFKKIFKLVKEDKGKIIIASILLALGSLVGLTYGYLNGAAFEAVTNLEIKKCIIYLSLYFLVSIISYTIFREIALLILNKVEINLSNKLMGNIYQKVLNLPAAAFEEKTSGELINRITSDTNALANTFSRLLSIILNIFGSLLVLFYVIYNSIIVFLEIVFAMLLLYYLSKKYSPLIKKTDEEVKNYNDDYTALVTESIHGVREIKTLGIKSNIFINVQKLMKNLFNLRNKQITTDIKYDVLTDLIMVLMEVGVFITCAILVYYGKAGITFYVAMTYYIYRYMNVISNLTEFNKTYQRVVVSISRVNEILENKLFQDEKFGEKTLTNSKGIIEFKNVNFSYPDQDQELILKDFNIQFEPHKKIAIVGKSGQGKSTIFNLLTKIFNVSKGKILIDDFNLNDLTEESLRNTLSVIRQEPFIFNETFKGNFKIVNPKISLKEIRNCTKMAYLDDYIMSLPKKYDTLIGEGGTNLSGGQKQRLAIARVLAKKSKIILFDEATSALDNESQEYIGKTINNLVKDHTVIIIAHRLSTIKDADIIYVIDDGKVSASGTHRELIKTSAIYKSLYKKDLE